MGATAAGLQTIETTLTNANALAVTNVATGTYTVSVTSKGAGANVFSINRLANGTITRTCTTAGTGSCHAGGVW